MKQLLLNVSCFIYLHNLYFLVSQTFHAIIENKIFENVTFCFTIKVHFSYKWEKCYVEPVSTFYTKIISQLSCFQ